MARDGSGNYNLPAGNPVVPNTTISSTQFNTTMSDLATALSGSLPRDGQASMTGPFRLPDGSAAVPSFGFNGEASTGLYRPGAGVLGFSVGAGERARLLSNGNLIIGSTSDGGQKLQVNGTASITGNSTIGGSATVANGITITTGGLTVSAGGATVTGTTTLNGAVSLNNIVTNSTGEAFCRRRSKSEPPCRPNIEPGVGAGLQRAGGG